MMKTSRSDVERNKRKINCPNSSWIGYSSSNLRFCDYFIYAGKLAKCHGQIRPISGGPWLILAQVAATSMQYSMERWVNPDEVLEIIPREKCRKSIESFFIETENFFTAGD